MSPPIMAEKAARVASVWDALRAHLSEPEWERLNLELFDRRHAGKDEVTHLLESWMLTLAMRANPDCTRQRAGFLETMRSPTAFLVGEAI